MAKVTITIRNDSTADDVDIFIDKKKVDPPNQTQVDSGTHALLWMAKGKAGQTVKITIITPAGVAARVDRTLKDANLVADGRTFVA